MKPETICRIVIERFAECGCPMIKLETFKPKVFFTEDLTIGAEVFVESTNSFMLSKDDEEEGCYVLRVGHVFIADAAVLASVLARKENLGGKVRIRIFDKNWKKICINEAWTPGEIENAIFTHDK